MPVEITDKSKCVGCNACYNICPQKCIHMEEDTCGFLYPKVDYNKCVKCNLCNRVCPVESPLKNEQYDKKVFAAWSKLADIRYKSTSGGLFYELAKQIIDHGGYVCGAEYKHPNYIRHEIYNTDSGLIRLLQSKYAQSNIELCFKRIKELLKDENVVLFCGTPCQVAGLKRYLQKEYESLYCLDFICRGVNSPKAYRTWISEQEQIYKQEITRVWFKYKSEGWKKSPVNTRIDFKNEKYKVLKGNKNSFMMGYLGPNLYIRPSCGNCNFKQSNHFSDITLGDFWGVSGDLDDDKGTSMVLVNSEKGIHLFKSIKNTIYCKERHIDEIFIGNKCINDSVIINLKSESFLIGINDKNFSKNVMKSCKTMRRNIFIRIIKKISRIVKGECK